MSTDSAGVPWEGRHFEQNPSSDDDGSAPPHLIEAIARFRAGESGAEAVVDAIRTSRLLVPLVAQLGESGTNDHGHTVDKSAELAIVTVAGPDGRTVLPAFSSVQAMARWNPRARPVPADAVRVALAAASEQTDLVVVDATSDDTEFVIRRPALWAIGQSIAWLPAYSDVDVVRAFLESAETEPAVISLTVQPGDPDARLTGPEVLVRLVLIAALDKPALDALLGRLQRRWAEHEIIATRVDSLGVRLAAG